MTNAFKIAALAGTAALASACSATAHEPLQTSPYSLDQTPDSHICKAGEDEVTGFMSIDDEFGYGIAVCVAKGAEGADDRVAVIFSGEGGNMRTECLASACEGLIEYKRYTRPRFTELTLKWSTPKGKHVLVETFDAQLLNAPPQRSVQHYWPGQEAGEAKGDAIISNTDPLALMTLENSLPAS